MRIPNFIKNQEDIVKNLSINLILTVIILIILEFASPIEVFHIISVNILLLIGVCSGTIVLTLYEKKYDEKKKKVIENRIELTLLVLILLLVTNILSPEIFGVYSGGFYLFFIVVISLSLFAHKILDEDNEMHINKKAECNEKNNKVILVGIILLFMIIRFGMPFLINGSYIDEYFHIFNGVNLEKEGKFASFSLDETPYVRGAYVSIIVGIFFKLFGEHILVAKIVPALIGTLNFILFLYISNKLISNKYYRTLAIILYTISPWTIFNHFYIRMFVVYEFFLLLTVLLFINLLKSIQERNKKLIGITLVAIIFSLVINSVNYLLIKDVGSLVVIGVTLIGILYIIIFESSNIEIEGEKLLSKTFRKILKIPTCPKIIYLVALFVIGSKIFGVFDDIILLTSLKIAHTTPTNMKYDHFFFVNNIILTLLFISSIFVFLRSKSKYVKLSIFLAIPLFIAHIMSSQDLQTIRAIFYFFPLYYLVSIVTLENINFKFKKLSRVLFILLIFLTIIINYPPNFSNQPNIPEEILYQDYQEAYGFVDKNCEGRKIYAILHQPHISLFYIKRVDYTAYINPGVPEIDSRYYKEGNKTFTVYGNIEVIQDKNYLEKLKVTSEKFCMITSDEYRHMRSYMQEKDYRELDGSFNFKKFRGLNVYWN